MTALLKLSNVKREAVDLTSDEVKIVINNFNDVLKEKIEEEAGLKEELDEKEKARLNALETLEKAGLPIPVELKEKITFKDLQAKTKRRTRKTKEEKQQEEMLLENVALKKLVTELEAKLKILNNVDSVLPKADAPKADAPKADAPKTDAPKAEAKTPYTPVFPNTSEAKAKQEEEAKKAEEYHKNKNKK